MIDKFTKVLVYLVVPVLTGNYVLKSPQKAPEATTEAKTEVSAEVAEPPSTPAPDLNTPEGIKQYITDVFGDQAKIAIAIATAESGLANKRSNSMNRNGTYDWGIFQINDCHCSKIDGDCHEKLLDPKFNIEFAKRIYDDSNWYPWSTYKNNAYKEHL